MSPPGTLQGRDQPDLGHHCWSRSPRKVSPPKLLPAPPAGTGSPACGWESVNLPWERARRAAGRTTTRFTTPGPPLVGPTRACVLPLAQEGGAATGAGGGAL